ncbi:hypothetical protein B0T17DRAFT_507477 [Bombardia bombarda]|uniref:Uncharacterized protein n=1 Tax=Bombardia bombarda TaxID=252184 RepID=A0AA40CAF6_9PEZI|nr:hypothetical protein B0T17DRAFT_507477 [Bombardia bombarda]
MDKSVFNRPGVVTFNSVPAPLRKSRNRPIRARLSQPCPRLPPTREVVSFGNTILPVANIHLRVNYVGLGSATCPSTSNIDLVIDLTSWRAVCLMEEFARFLDDEVKANPQLANRGAINERAKQVVGFLRQYDNWTSDKPDEHEDKISWKLFWTARKISLLLGLERKSNYWLSYYNEEDKWGKTNDTKLHDVVIHAIDWFWTLHRGGQQQKGQQQKGQQQKRQQDRKGKQPMKPGTKTECPYCSIPVRKRFEWFYGVWVPSDADIAAREANTAADAAARKAAAVAADRDAQAVKAIHVAQAGHAAADRYTQAAQAARAAQFAQIAQAAQAAQAAQGPAEVSAIGYDPAQFAAATELSTPVGAASPDAYASAYQFPAAPTDNIAAALRNVITNILSAGALPGANAPVPNMSAEGIEGWQEQVADHQGHDHRELRYIDPRFVQPDGGASANGRWGTGKMSNQTAALVEDSAMEDVNMGHAMNQGRGPFQPHGEASANNDRDWEEISNQTVAHVEDRAMDDVNMGNSGGLFDNADNMAQFYANIYDC